MPRSSLIKKDPADWTDSTSHNRTTLTQVIAEAQAADATGNFADIARFVYVYV